MASDFRALQHDAAMASFSLTTAVSLLREMHQRHPRYVAAEYEDIETASADLQFLLANIKRNHAA